MARQYLLLILIALVNCVHATKHAKAIVCNQEYVLCTSAPCIPDPRHKNYAICSCDVEKGASIGYKHCADRAAKQDAFKVKQLVSTFSFKQFTTKKGMTCPKGTPWTDCVDAPCTVNPMDATKAICSCKINNHQSFVTLGGACNVNTCSNAFWSGSISSASEVLRNTLLEQLNRTPPSKADINCPR